MEGSSSSAVSSALPARRTFPPQLLEVEELLNGDATSAASSSSQVKALRCWCDALLEQVAEVSRGSSTDAPLEEVWHWLAASGQLTRSASFAKHSTVADLLARISEHGGQEGIEATSRWHEAIGQLRVLQKESSWNAQYLRIVEEPLRQLESDEAVYSGSLASVVRRLLRSLNHVFCSAENFKEHRMATLLNKILKELVKQAGRHLASPYEVGAPKDGFDVSLRSAQQLRDSFKAYVDHFFIYEPAAADKLPGLERRPATALGTRGDRSHTIRRRDASDLGWWRATVRTSLTHAEHCSIVCHRIANLLSACRWLTNVLPALRSVDPLILQQAESFIQLHGGVKGSGNMLALLDLKCQFDMLTRLQEVEEKLQPLITHVDSMGIPSFEDASLDSVADSKGRIIVESGGSLAEVLTLSSAPEVTEARASTAAGGPRECDELQKDIAGMREELRQFGSQLENLTDMARQKSARARLPFNPMPRTDKTWPAAGNLEEEEEDAASSKADHATALEVAKRSTWYREPPSCIPQDVEVISVRQDISFRLVSDGSGRPRTSQPCLLLTRPSTAPAGGFRDIASREDRASSTQQEILPEEAHDDLEAEEKESPEEGTLVEEAERADIQHQVQVDVDASGTLLETAAENTVGTDLDQQDPFCISAPSWRIA